MRITTLIKRGFKLVMETIKEDVLPRCTMCWKKLREKDYKQTFVNSAVVYCKKHKIKIHARHKHGTDGVTVATAS